MYKSGEYYYSNAGGIVGILSAGTADKKLEAINCKNTGNVYGKGPQVGGVFSCANGYNNIENCENRGNVTGESNYVGGINGTFSNNSLMKECRNYGMIDGKGYGTGGIIGGGLTTSCTIEKCYNIGNVSGDTKVGGIRGDLKLSAGRNNNNQML